MSYDLIPEESMINAKSQPPPPSFIQKSVDEAKCISFYFSNFLQFIFIQSFSHVVYVEKDFP